MVRPTALAVLLTPLVAVFGRVWSGVSGPRSRGISSSGRPTVELGGRDGVLCALRGRPPDSTGKGSGAEVLGAGVGDDVVAVVG
jgi:hypothetical protein